MNRCDPGSCEVRVLAREQLSEMRGRRVFSRVRGCVEVVWQSEGRLSMDCVSENRPRIISVLVGAMLCAAVAAADPAATKDRTSEATAEGGCVEVIEGVAVCFAYSFPADKAQAFEKYCVSRGGAFQPGGCSDFVSDKAVDPASMERFLQRFGERWTAD